MKHPASLFRLNTLSPVLALLFGALMTVLMVFSMPEETPALEAASVFAGVEPTYDVIFDDFTYADTSELFGSNVWKKKDGTTYETARAWYLVGWNDKEPGLNLNLADDAHIGLTGTHVRLESEIGHTREFKNPNYPAMIKSGFSHRTGTWAAQVRLDGIASASSQIQAFWTHSSKACVVDPGTGNCPRANTRWSEFNHEWNNYFPNPEGLTLDQKANAAGVISDAWDPDDETLYMVDPLETNAGDLTCYEYDGGSFTHIDDAEDCLDWFVSNDDPDKTVNFFIQYDGDTLVQQAVAWDWDVGDFRVMKVSRVLGRSAQPMTSFFAMLMGNNEAQDTDDLGLSVDWFFYTPSTSPSIWNIRDNVDWFRDPSRNLTRVNTTGESTAAPGLPAAIDIDTDTVLETPLDATGSDPEWTVVPTVGAGRLYRIRWQHRTKATSSSSWSNWTSLVTRGYTYDPVNPSSYYGVEVKVIVSDWKNSSDEVTVCRALYYWGSHENICGGASKNGSTEAPAVPSEFSLSEAYPNPFNPTTTIKYALKEDAQVRLVVYDMLGREVATLVDAFQNAGYKEVQWNGYNGTGGPMPSGTYAYQLVAGDFIQSRTMVLLK